jgi:hypothetical protein
MTSLPRQDGFSDLSQSSQRSRDAALLRATTELFIHEPSHDRDAIRRYEELATHFLPRVAMDDRVYVAERLADRGDAPQAVMRMLAKDAITVARPVLSRSPVLGPLDLLSVIAATGSEHHRLIAARANLTPDVLRALKLMGDPETMVLLEIAQSGEAAAPAQKATSPRPGGPERTAFDRSEPSKPISLDPDLINFANFLAAERSTRLRLMADLASLPPRRNYGGHINRLDQAFRSILGAAQIVGFARRTQRQELIEAIAGGLSLDQRIVTASMEDLSGEPFAILLKALGLDNIQAQQVLLLATPAIGQDVSVFFRLVDLYAAMEPFVAETLVANWSGAVPAKTGEHEPHLAENGQARRSNVAATFRDRRPAAEEGGARTGTSSG